MVDALVTVQAIQGLLHEETLAQPYHRVPMDHMVYCNSENLT